MDIQKWLNDQNIEAVQDRKDGKDYWMYDNLYTEIDLIELLEAFFLHGVSQQRELLEFFVKTQASELFKTETGFKYNTDCIEETIRNFNCA